MKEKQDAELTRAERAELEMYRQQRKTSIEDYHEFGKYPVGSPERMAAYISHLSPHNLRRGADALRDWYESSWTALDQGATCCADKHQTFYGAIVTSSQWEAWQKKQNKEPTRDMSEVEGMGIMSSSHLQEFLDFCVDLENKEESKD